MSNLALCAVYASLAWFGYEVKTTSLVAGNLLALGLQLWSMR